MDCPLISIIIPVYNVEKFINDCMASVCHQTYQNLEIILVDDGAKDSSGKICDEWAKKDSRIVVIHKTNGGLSDARNAGIKASSGKYLMFIDSDDVVSESLVEHLYSSIKETGAQISICDPVHIKPGEQPIYQNAKKQYLYNAEEALCEMMYQTSFLFSAWGKLYQAELFNDISFPVGLLFEDVAVMYKLFDKCEKIAYSDAKLYGYLHRENSITTAKFSKRDCDILGICQEQVLFAKNFSPQVYKAAITYHVVGALRVYLNASNSDEYREEIHLSKNIIRQNKTNVLFNNRCRTKLRIGMLLFCVSEKLMRRVYTHVDRWK